MAVETTKKTAPRGRWIADFMGRIVAALGPPSAPRRTLQAVTVVLGASVLCGCAWLDERQRVLALRPSPARQGQAEASAASFRPGDLRYFLPANAAAEQVAVWWLPHSDPHAPTLLYLHGTFRNLYQNLPKIEALRKAGFGVLAVDYRGWGDSSALVPSEATIGADAALAWSEVQRLQPDARRRYIFGHSMGGAVAVRLASGLRGGQDYAALVLESTFTRMPDVASATGFWGRIVAAATTLEFDSIARIGRIDAPLLMLHGSADRTVPVELGRRLRDAAPAGVRWVEIAGGGHSRLHSDAPEIYQEALRGFVQNRKSHPAAPTRATSP